MGTEMILANIKNNNNAHNKIDDYIKKFELEQKHRGLFKSIALLSKKPAIKIAKRATLNDVSDSSKLKMSNETNKHSLNANHKLWKASQIFVIPPMPDDYDEEKAIVDCDYKCKYCDNLCDVDNLRCKACADVYHIECLYHRGHLNTLEVPAKSEWTCSDCNDLSKLLNEEEMLKLINLFDELDSNKDCIVKCNEYIRLKKKICEEYGQPMGLKEEDAERRHFRLMDTDHSGSITWNEFINYEAPSLLSKNNKVELSNNLTLRELILIKKRFLTLDKSKLGMISKEDARAVYIEYIQKIRKKLGRSFEEHLRNCDKLLGLSNESMKLNENSSNHKVTWDEFVRKMSILIIFDRLNAEVLAPKLWKPGNWFQANLDRELTQFQRQKTLTFFKNLNKMPTIINPSTTQKKNLFKINPNKFIDIDYLMKNDINIENYKPYDDGDFGSNLYVIRSSYEKTYHDKPSRSSMKKFVSSSHILPPIESRQDKQRNTSNENLTSNKDEIETNKVKTVQIGNETPITIHTITTMSNFTDKTTISKPNILMQPALPSIPSAPVQNPNESSQKQKQENEVPYKYEDIIKKMHETKRFVHTSVLSRQHKSHNDLKMKKYRTVIPSINESMNTTSSSKNTTTTTTSTTNSSFFVNNDIGLKNELFRRLSGRQLPELDFNSRSTAASSIKYNRSKYAQSLDTFYKNSGRQRRRYMKTNHVIWGTNGLNINSILENNNNNNNTSSNSNHNTSSYFNESKNNFTKSYEKSLVF